MAGKREQLTILTLAIDGEKEKRVRRFVERCKVTLPVLLDMNEKVARAYGVKMVPTAYLLDQEGMMLGMMMGQRDWSSPIAWSAIKELLNR
jgi:peroxiredoxin